MPPIRVLIVDDHRLFRNGLVSMFAGRPDVLVVGEAGDGNEAIQKARELRPDVILLDLLMPGMSGLDVLRRIRAERADARVIMLTASESDSHVIETLQSGAQGYLLKTCEPDDLFRALRAAMAGQPTVSGVIAAGLVRQMSKAAKPAAAPDTLTQREVEVLRLVASGATNKEIASDLNITVNTVKNHLSEILDKLHLQNRTQAANYAMNQGMVTDKARADKRDVS